MSQTNRLLGYPDDARLLIVNADDFGMCHAVNAGILEAIQSGIVQSTTLMTPCPWGDHALHLLRQHPEIAFGVHLTMVSEQPIYRWGALSSPEKVPSLLDESGYFYSEPELPELLANVPIEEVELEFRAQIEKVLRAGLQPTHLDWHCMHNGGSPEIFDLTLHLAKEYGLAVRVYDPAYSATLQARSLPTNDYPLLDSYSLALTDKSAQYARLLRELPAGLSEWAVHPAHDDPEMRAVEPGSPVRPTDFAFVTSPEARAIIQQEGIILLDYRALQPLWQQA